MPGTFRAGSFFRYATSKNWSPNGSYRTILHIYSPVGDNIVPFYSQLRHQNPSVPVISSDVISEEHVKQAPAVFDGIYQSQMGDPKGDKMVELSGSYAKKFNKPLTLSWFVATGYDSVKLIAFCSKKVGARPIAVRDCIANTKGVIGVSQTFSFNEGGSSPQQESVFQLTQGRFTLAESRCRNSYSWLGQEPRNLSL